MGKYIPLFEEFSALNEAEGVDISGLEEWLENSLKDANWEYYDQLYMPFKHASPALRKDPRLDPHAPPSTRKGIIIAVCLKKRFDTPKGGLNIYQGINYFVDWLSANALAGTSIADLNTAILLLEALFPELPTYAGWKVEKAQLEKDVPLYGQFVKSGLSMEDFSHQKRGTLKGQEFGF